MPQAASLDVLSGALCVKVVVMGYSTPVEYTLWYRVRVANKSERVNLPGLPCVLEDGKVKYTIFGTVVAEYFDCDREPVKVCERPVPCPKHGAKAQTRYAMGRWQKRGNGYWTDMGDS